MKLTTPAVALATATLLLLTACSPYSSSQLESFASCLNENNATYYGAYWCPNCAQQNQLFQGAKDSLDYVECSKPNRGGQTLICQTQNITSYPTWEFADGTRREGIQQLETLAQITGCELPE